MRVFQCDSCRWASKRLVDYLLYFSKQNELVQKKNILPGHQYKADHEIQFSIENKSKYNKRDEDKFRFIGQVASIADELWTK